jgi:putative hydrolase of the HAD superfamily
VGAKKPNPKVFEHALALAGVTATTSMMIGDSFEADILGAEAVGFKTIFFNYRNQDVAQGRIAVNSLDAIKNHL